MDCCCSKLDLRCLVFILTLFRTLSFHFEMDSTGSLVFFECSCWLQNEYYWMPYWNLKCEAPYSWSRNRMKWFPNRTIFFFVIVSGSFIHTLRKSGLKTYFVVFIIWTFKYLHCLYNELETRTVISEIFYNVFTSSFSFSVDVLSLTKRNSSLNQILKITITTR